MNAATPGRIGEPTRRGERMLLLALFLLPFLFFWPLTLGRATLAQGDFLEVIYPLRHHVAQSLAMGQLPLWNSHINSGQPALADPQTAALYPLNLAFMLLSWPWQYPVRALEIEVLFHVSLAGIFTYLYARHVLKANLPAFFAALVFAFGGYLTSFPLAQVPILETAIWLPLALWFLELAFEQDCLWWHVAAGATVGLSFLAGHPQTELYVALCVLLYWVWRWGQDFPPRRHGDYTENSLWDSMSPVSRWFRLVGLRPGFAIRLQSGLAGLLCLGLAWLTVASPQLLPTLEFVSLSSRATLSYQEASAGLPVAELWGLLLPVSGGNPALYVGLPALLLAPFSLGLGKERGLVLFWATLAAGAVLLALGDQGFLYPFLYSLVPGMGIVRHQERALLLFSLAMALLAGGGMKVLLNLAAGRRSARLALAGLTLALLVNLGIAPTHIALTEARDLRELAPDGLTTFLQQAWQEGAPFRVSSEGLLPYDGNAAILFGLEDVVGNTPMQMGSYQGLLQNVPEWQWWHLLNVRFVVTKRILTHGALALVHQQENVQVYQLYGELPRAWLVHEAVPVASQEEAWQIVSGPEFQADRMAVIRGGPEVHAPAQADAVRLTGQSAETLHVAVETATPGYLLVSQNDYPGWWAFVDGQPAPTYRANGWQPAVYVPPGSHQISLVYVPFSFLGGLVLSLLSVVAMVVIRRRVNFAPCTS